MTKASTIEPIAMRPESPAGTAGPEGARKIEPHWYAVYTCAHHEKRVAEQFHNRGVEHFLPQFESVRKWKDRKVRLQLPLFPGYVFVHLALSNRLPVLQVPGVVRLVAFNGQPVPLPEGEIGAIRNALKSARLVKPHSYLQVGRRVRILSGPLEGMAGIVVKRKNRTRLVISLDLIQRSVSVEVSDTELCAIAPDVPHAISTVSPTGVLSRHSFHFVLREAKFSKAGAPKIPMKKFSAIYRPRGRPSQVFQNVFSLTGESEL